MGTSKDIEFLEKFGSSFFSCTGLFYLNFSETGELEGIGFKNLGFSPVPSDE